MPSPISFDTSTLINFHRDGSIVLLANHFRGRAFVAGHIEDVELGPSSGTIVTAGGFRWIERIEISGAADLRRAAKLQSLLGSTSRHRGEAEAMIICEDRTAVLATDDGGAALVAQFRRIRTASTVDILNALVAKKHLGPRQAAEIALRMQEAGQNVDASKIYTGRSSACASAVLASYAHAANDLDAARSHARDALALLRTDKHPLFFSIAIEHVAQVATLRGDPRCGALLQGYADNVLRSVAHARSSPDQRCHEKHLALLTQALGPEALAQYEAEGALLSDDQALQRALAV